MKVQYLHKFKTLTKKNAEKTMVSVILIDLVTDEGIITLLKTDKINENNFTP